MKPFDLKTLKLSKAVSALAKKLNAVALPSRQRKRRVEFKQVAEALKEAYPRMSRSDIRKLIFKRGSASA